MALTDKQKGVLRGMAAGGFITLATVLGTGLWQLDFLTPADTTAGRISFALHWSLLPVLCLALNIGRLARHRFFTPEDIDGGGLTTGTDTARVIQSNLQNTLEQTALALPVYLIWSVSMPVGWLDAIPGAASCFFLGRLFFWRGYRRGAPSRALGFAMTFYPSVLMSVILAALLAARAIG